MVPPEVDPPGQGTTELRRDGVLRSSASRLVPVLATTTDRLRSRDQGAQPYPSRGVSRDDVAEVVHPKVHTAEAYKHHQKCRSAHHRHTSLPGSQGEHGEVGQHPVGDEGLHRVAAGEGVAGLHQQGVREVGGGRWKSPFSSQSITALPATAASQVPRRVHRRPRARTAATTTPKITMASREPKAVTTRKKVVRGAVAWECR